MVIRLTLTKEMIECFNQCSKDGYYGKFCGDHESFLTELCDKLKCVSFPNVNGKDLVQKRTLFLKGTLCKTISLNASGIFAYLRYGDPRYSTRIIDGAYDLEQHFQEFCKDLKYAILNRDFNPFYWMYRSEADYIVSEARRQQIIDFAIDDSIGLHENFESRDSSDIYHNDSETALYKTHYFIERDERNHPRREINHDYICPPIFGGIQGKIQYFNTSSSHNAFTQTSSKANSEENLQTTQRSDVGISLQQEEVNNLKNQLGQLELLRNQSQEEIYNQFNYVSRLEDYVHSLEAENTQFRTGKETMLGTICNLENSLETLKQRENLLNEENKLLKEKKLSLQNEVSNLRTQFEKITKEHKATEEVQTLQTELNKSELIIKEMTKKYTTLENDLRIMATQATTKLNVLNEKVAHFAEELLEKRNDLPTIGQNNTEELEIQKFVDFVVDSTIQLMELAPDGLNLSSEQLPLRIPIENCMLCHEQPRFAKCSTENCGSTYHKKCIKQWYKTRKNCPCCQNDSVRFEEDSTNE